MTEVGFYQGCCFQGQDAHMFPVMEEVFRRLGVKLRLLEETTCCGGNVIEEENRKLSYAINARNMAIAFEKDLDMLITCNTCYMVIAKAKIAMDRNKKLKKELNLLLSEEGLRYRRSGKIYHLLDFLRDVVGYERIKREVRRPLSGWKLAVYYGCHVLFPGEMRVDDSDNPTVLQDILKALGAEVIDDYEGKDTCCGYHAFYTDRSMTLKKLKKILNGAKEKGAEMIVTPCPLCFKAFDIYQLKLEDPPMLASAYLPEIMAYAFGMSARESGLSFHLIDIPRKL